MIRLFRRWYSRYKTKQFRKAIYPVKIVSFPKSEDMVLIRCLKTHEYGGWLQSKGFVVKEWGEPVLKQLEKEAIA